MESLTESRPDIASLFDFESPTPCMLYSILDGPNRGEILVDSAARPTQAVVRNGVGLTFISPGADPAFAMEALAVLRETGMVG